MGGDEPDENCAAAINFAPTLKRKDEGRA